MNYIKRNSLLISALLVLVFIFAIDYFVKQTKELTQNETQEVVFNESNSNEDISNQPQQEEFSVELRIPELSDQPIEVAAVEGETVLSLLQKASDLELQVQEFDFGVLVESIGGVVNGTDGKYWIYTVNGEQAQVGASDYILSNGDTVLWEFKTYDETE